MEDLFRVSLNEMESSRNPNGNRSQFSQTLCFRCAIFILIVFLVGFLSSCVEDESTDNQQDESTDLMLSDCSKLFQKDTLIVVGENASEVESEIAKNMQSTLEKLTGNKPIIKTFEVLSEDNKAKSNIIVIITPNTEGVPKDIYVLINKPKITDDYPGKNKGVLEIVRNPWNKERTLLIVAGSDEWGLKVSELVLRQQRLEKKHKMIIDWEEYTRVEFPIDSEEEAIGYAKTDFSAEVFVKKLSDRNTKVNYWARWHSDNNEWVVAIKAVGVQDIMYEMHFKSLGTFTAKFERSF